MLSTITPSVVSSLTGRRCSVVCWCLLRPEHDDDSDDDDGDVFELLTKRAILISRSLAECLIFILTYSTLVLNIDDDVRVNGSST